MHCLIHNFDTRVILIDSKCKNNTHFEIIFFLKHKANMTLYQIMTRPGWGWGWWYMYLLLGKWECRQPEISAAYLHFELFTRDALLWFISNHINLYFYEKFELALFWHLSHSAFYQIHVLNILMEIRHNDPRKCADGRDTPHAKSMFQ